MADGLEMLANVTVKAFIDLKEETARVSPSYKFFYVKMLL